MRTAVSGSQPAAGHTVSNFLSVRNQNFEDRESSFGAFTLLVVYLENPWMSNRFLEDSISFIVVTFKTQR